MRKLSEEELAALLRHHNEAEEVRVRLAAQQQPPPLQPRKDFDPADSAWIHGDLQQPPPLPKKSSPIEKVFKTLGKS